MRKPSVLTLRDSVRAVARAVTPLARGLGQALSVTDYLRGRVASDPDLAAHTERSSMHQPASRPRPRWPWENTWGTDPEFERAERELWTEQSFLDADTGVTYRESTWDGRWQDDEWWR